MRGGEQTTAGRFGARKPSYMPGLHGFTCVHVERVPFFGKILRAVIEALAQDAIIAQ